MGMPFSLSTAARRPWLEGLGLRHQIESEDELLRRFKLVPAPFDMVRCPQGSLALKTASIAAGIRWADGPVLWNARLEWPVWFREQAVTETLHRYGNIIPKP
jgi:RHH-type proline utilization regulon transcriptional repressor/proline dehydrogenase/delta 1-pyrroline-5-carboxylate dehydrogenase